MRWCQPVETPEPDMRVMRGLVNNAPPRAFVRLCLPLIGGYAIRTSGNEGVPLSNPG